MRLVVSVLLAASCGGAGQHAGSVSSSPNRQTTPADTGVRPTLDRPAAVSGAQAAPVLAALKEELDRTFAALGNRADGPYFLGYQVTDIRSLSLRASFGALISTDEGRRRVLDVDVRVGDHRRDNTHPLR